MPETACACFVHWDQPFLVEHSPWLFWLKEVITYPSRTILNVLQSHILTPSGCTSHRWHLNLSVTVIAIHRYNSILSLCCKTSFQGSLSLPWMKSCNRRWKTKRKTKRDKWKCLDFRKTIMSSHLYIELNLSQRRRPIDVSWMGRESYCDSQFQSMNTGTATQQLPVNLPEHRKDKSTQVTA